MLIRIKHLLHSSAVRYGEIFHSPYLTLTRVIIPGLADWGWGEGRGGGERVGEGVGEREGWGRGEGEGRGEGGGGGEEGNHVQY